VRNVWPPAEPATFGLEAAKACRQARAPMSAINNGQKDFRKSVGPMSKKHD